MSHLYYQRSYRRNLPHIQPPGATLFVTFRLAGSLPQSVIVQWKEERRRLACLAKTNPSHYERVKFNFERARFTKFDGLLDDTAVGPVWLRDERVAAIVDESSHYRDGKVYRLDAFTIMPNHVHMVVKPLAIREGEDGYHALASIMQSLKGYTSFKCNQLLARPERRILGTREL